MGSAARGLARLGLIGAALLAGCADAKPASELRGGSDVDRLLERIAEGGKARDTASSALSKRLNDTEGELRADEELLDDTLDGLFDALDPLIAAGPPVCGSWADTSDYTDLRFAAELVLDVAGRAGAPQVLERGLSSRDPYLAAWALLAQRDAGEDTSREVVARVGVDDEARSLLDSRMRDLLPAELSGTEADARADMAQWLAYGAELGCQPAKLVLRERIQRGERAYYLFTFTPGGDGDDADVPQAGVSGPWSSSGELAEKSDTFSAFEPAAKRTPAQHLDELLAATP